MVPEVVTQVTQVRGLPGCRTCELECRQQCPSYRDGMLSGGWKGSGCECEKVHFMGIPDRGQKGAGSERQGWNGMTARLRLGAGQGGWEKQLQGQVGESH